MSGGGRGLGGASAGGAKTLGEPPPKLDPGLETARRRA